MTKYVTTEEQLQCMSCEIHCTQRELVDGKRCPNCRSRLMNTLPVESLDEILRGEI